MAETQRDARFFTPVMAVIRQTLIDSGLPFDSIRLGELIERDGQSGAGIMSSHQIPSVTNRTTERPSGGAIPNCKWRNDDGHLVVRHLRAKFVAHFDVQIYSPQLAASCDFLFDFVANLPRNCLDGQRFAGYNDALTPAADRVPVDQQGNQIELTPISPIFPELRTSTARLYRSSVIVRAESGIYLDLVRGVPVTAVLRQPTIL